MVHEINGALAFIELKNYKVERSLGDGFNDNVAPSIIPITASLKSLLVQLGYEDYKQTQEYILCPNRSDTSSNAIMNNLSKGFSHSTNAILKRHYIDEKVLSSAIAEMTIFGD